jgi:hypothetical protein
MQFPFPGILYFPAEHLSCPDAYTKERNGPRINKASMARESVTAGERRNHGS